MASNSKSSGRNDGGGEPLSFEESLRKLESIVESMEGGDLPLEQMLQRYEEGTRLVKVCQGKIEEAELKIQELEKSAGGELILKPVKVGNADD